MSKNNSDNSSHRLIIILIVFFAAFITRFAYLRFFPQGLHGDEAWTGMRADYIIKNGWIGFYDKVHSIGQWALPEYFTVPFKRYIADPYLSIRIPMAILGVLSIVLFTDFTFSILGLIPAIYVGALFITLPPFFLLSRVAFPGTSAIFFSTLSLWLFEKAYRYRKKYIFFSVGICLSLGALSYGAFPCFAIAMFISLFWYLYYPNKHDFPKGYLKKIGNIGLLFTGILPSLGIIIYCYRTEPLLRIRSQSASIFNLRTDLEWYEIYWQRILYLFKAGFIEPLVDLTDGLGSSTLFDYPSVSLLAISLIILIFTKDLQIKFWGIFLTTIVFFTFGLTIFLSNMGLFRRLLPIFPLLFFIFTLPLSDTIINKKWGVKTILHILLISTITVQITKTYEIFSNKHVNWVYCPELSAAAEFLDKLPQKPAFIFFYSSRWPYNYETFRYLFSLKNPNIPILNRSREFGYFKIEKAEPGTAFLLFDNYLSILELIQNVNPAGEGVISKNQFSYYLVK